MIIKMIMCNQMGMQENEYIKDLSKKILSARGRFV